MAIGQLIINKNRNSPVLIVQAFLHHRYLFLGNLQTRPSIPAERRGLGQAAQAADQAAGRHGKIIFAVIRTFDGDGQSVGNEQQPRIVALRALGGRHGGGRGVG